MEDNKDEEDLFPINLMVLKEHYWDQLLKYFEKVQEPFLLIDPELKLNIEYILSPVPKNVIFGVKVLNDNFEQEFEKLKVDQIKRVVFVIKPW